MIVLIIYFSITVSFGFFLDFENDKCDAIAFWGKEKKQVGLREKNIKLVYNSSV